MFAVFCALAPLPVFELVSELEPVLELEVARWFEPELEPVPVLELVPELDPVLGLEVASEPELKPVPVLELELGFEDLQCLSPDLDLC